MLPLLPIMIGLTAEELLAGTVLGAAAAVGLANLADQFRRGNPRDLGLVDTGLPSLAEMAADLIAGANLPVGFGPPPNWNPIGDGLAALTAAAEQAWGQINSKKRTSGGGGSAVTLTNNTGATVSVWFTVYEVGNLPPELKEPKGYILSSEEIYSTIPWYNPWASYRTVDVELPPGATNVDLSWFATGNPNPNGRDSFFRLTAGGQTYNLSITDYRPGQFLGYAILGLPGSITKGSAPAGVSYPNSLTPSEITSQPATAALAAPLPAAVGDWIDYGYLGIPQPAAATEATAPLPAVAPIPRPLPLPAAPVPQKTTDLDRAGRPVPQAAPAVKPTAVTDHIVGDLKIPAKAPQATMQGIAEEVGRIEQKLSIMLNPASVDNAVDWMDLIGKIWELLSSATGDGIYTLSSPCDLDENKQRIIKQAPYSGALNSLGVLNNKVDALALLMQHAKDLKQPNCTSKVPPSTVTVTAYELPPYS